jgi:hypothetical protein
MQKWLESRFRTRQPFIKPKQREPKVTIAIGLIHRQKTDKLRLGELPAIWMASDSQTTYGSTKRENPNKINVIDFANGQILIAQADSVELGDRTIEKLRRRAKDVSMIDFETAVNTVRLALLEVRSELMDWNKGCNIDLEKFFWTEHRLNLLIGYFFKGNPYLYKMDIYRGIPTAVNSFEAIGGGESLGYFLLKENAQANPDFEYGLPIIISVVEKVIDNVDGCGRPTWVGHVFPMPVEIQTITHSTQECFAQIMRPQDVELISHELKISDARWATMQKEHIVKVMKRASKKFQRPFIKQLTSHERFIRLRYGKNIADALKIVAKHITKSGNAEARKLIKDFNKELGGGNNKSILKSIWESICQALPSVAEIPNVTIEISKLF